MRLNLTPMLKGHLGPETTLKVQVVSLSSNQTSVKLLVALRLLKLLQHSEFITVRSENSPFASIQNCRKSWHDWTASCWTHS